MKKEIDTTERILCSLKHLERKTLNPRLLDEINKQIDSYTERVIPLKKLKVIMIAASLLFMINTIAIISNITSNQEVEDYVMEDTNSIVSDYTIYK